MVEKQVKISVTTEVDAANVDDLSQKIQELQNSMVNIDFNIDDASINNLSDLVEKIDGENVELHIDTDDGELTEAYALVTDLNGNVTRINFDTDTGSLTEVQEEINKLSDNNVEVNVIADNTRLIDTSNIIEEINNLPVSVDVLVDTGDVEALQEELNEATSEVERLESELSSIEMGEIDGDFDTVSIELENAQTRVEELQSSLDNLNASSTSDISGSFDEIGSSADNANTEIDELQGSLDLMNAGALMSISSELGALGDKAEGMAQDMNQAAISVGQLSTNTGIAEPELVDMINYISNATFPQNEAIAYVDMLNQMGVKADRLGDSATNIDRINDATGMGYQNAMQLVRGFGALGVRGDNLESTFNAVAYAEANSIGGADEMGTILKRQAGTLNEYHVGVDAATVAISDLSHKYGSAMKAGGALSQALKDNNGDLRAVEQQLGLQEGALTNATDLTGQYQGKLMELAKEEEEHRTWIEQLGAAWEDMTLKLSPVLSQLSSVMGVIGQVGSLAVGINGITTLANNFRKLEVVKSVGGKLSGLKSNISGVGSAARTASGKVLTLAKNLGSTVLEAAKNAGLAFLNLGKQVLTAGYNALKTVGMWLAQKVQLLGSAMASGIATIKNWLLAASEWAVASPILVVVGVIALLIAALTYLYFNNEQVRQAVDGLGQSFMWVGQIIYTAFVTAVDWVISALQNLWNYILTLGGLLPANVSLTGNQIVDTILRVVLFVLTLPLQIGMVFTNIIAKALGFGDNFTQRLITGAISAVNGFINKIRELPGMIQGEFARIEGIVSGFITSLPQRVWDLGASIVNALKSALGIGSPGHMFYMFEGELNRLKDLPDSMKSNITHNVAGLGTGIVESFNQGQLEFNTRDISLANDAIIESGNNSGDVYNFYFDGMILDSEQRMEQMYQYISHRLSWNNKTAGRRV